MFSHPSILFDFKSQLQITKKITNILSKSDHLEVRSSLGTSLKMNIKGRKANCCPGFVDKNHLLGSPLILRQIYPQLKKIQWKNYS